jgi:20S proteasome alpha/beta subunit
MGSGSLNAMAVFEAGYKDDMSREEAMALAARAIRRCGSQAARKQVYACMRDLITTCLAALVP